MKFQMTVKTESMSWTEEYDDMTIGNVEAAEKYCLNLVARFNNTLRPHEKPRTVVSVCIIGQGTAHLEHSWVKDATRMSQMSTKGIFDGFTCSVCGIKGKRFGSSQKIVNESKYSKKVFRTCTPEALAECRLIDSKGD